MNTDNTYLVTMPIFGVKKTKEGKAKISHSAIINYAHEHDNGEVSMITKRGKLTQNVSDFDAGIKLFKMKDVCLEELMYDWSKHNKNEKPFVIDETIDSYEILKSDFSPLEIMVERRENEIAIKPIFL